MFGRYSKQELTQKFQSDQLMIKRVIKQNPAMDYEIAESAVVFDGLTVAIKLCCKRTLGDRNCLLSVRRLVSSHPHFSFLGHKHRMAVVENDYMVCWKFYLTINSAEHLPNVREVFKTRAYAKISIGSDEKKIKRRTNGDKDNGLNPAWNHAMEYEIAESGVLYYGMSVVIKVYCERTLGDRYIGAVHTTMKDLFDRARQGSAKLSLPIMKGDAETGGTLKFSYGFGQRFTVKKSDFQNKVSRFGAWWIAMDVAAEVATQAILFAILAVT